LVITRVTVKPPLYWRVKPAVGITLGGGGNDVADPLGVTIGGVEAVGPGGEAAQVALEPLQLSDALADLFGPVLE
jgi:hypothetical protein